jgi:hypothetical protein
VMPARTKILDKGYLRGRSPCCRRRQSPPRRPTKTTVLPEKLATRHYRVVMYRPRQYTFHCSTPDSA